MSRMHRTTTGTESCLASADMGKRPRGSPEKNSSKAEERSGKKFYVATEFEAAEEDPIDLTRKRGWQITGRV